MLNGRVSRGGWTSTRDRASMTSSSCGASISTVRVASSNGPMRLTERAGVGDTVTPLRRTVCPTVDGGVSRSTQRAKVTMDS